MGNFEVINPLQLRVFDVSTQSMIYSTDEKYLFEVTHTGLANVYLRETMRVYIQNAEPMMGVNRTDCEGVQLFTGDILLASDGAYHKVIFDDIQFNIDGFYNPRYCIPESGLSEWYEERNHVVGNIHTCSSLKLNN